MPGHKGGAGAPQRGIDLFGRAAYEADLSEMGGFDYLHGATSALITAQHAAAVTFGADRTFFLVNGATVGNLAAITATCADGDTLLMARASHRSVYAALVVAGATPSYLSPIANHELDGLFGVDPSDIAQALETDPSIRAVHVTSPSYYGFTLPIDEIADLAHAHGVPLIVDEAHGSHFCFHSEFPSTALAQGADAVVQSPHKTLGSFTQSSLLHVSGERIDVARLDQALQMMQSSSPSALLLVSLDVAISEMATTGEPRWGEAIRRANSVRAALSKTEGLRIYGTEVVNGLGIWGYDPTKLVVDVAGLHITGQAASTWLREVRHINPEFSDLRRIIFSITTGDDDAAIEVLVDALCALAAQRAPEHTPNQIAALWPRDSPPLRCTPRQGFGKRTVAMPVERAIGSVSAEMIVPYPPGVPLLVPGELLTQAVLRTLTQLLDAGCHVVGMADPSGTSIRCLDDVAS